LGYEFESGTAQLRVKNLKSSLVHVRKMLLVVPLAFLSEERCMRGIRYHDLKLTPDQSANRKVEAIIWGERAAYRELPLPAGSLDR